MRTRDDDPDRRLLRDALALGPHVELRRFAREPLGAGAVTGFEVHHEGADLVYYVDTSRRAVAAETGLAIGQPDAPDARVWLHPADPHLPALAPLAFSHAAEALLARLGVHTVGAPEIVGYRPGRRAVLRVATTDGDVWLKAVPPSRVVRLAQTHEALHEAGVPVPVLRGWSEEGVLVFASASGTPVAQALGDAAHPLTGDMLLGGVDRLRRAFAAVPLTLPSRSDLRRRLDWYAERLLGTDAATRAERVRRIRDDALARWGRDRRGVIHGDLHFGQLFVDARGGVSGVIDVDTAGVGHPADDTAAFVSHAVASATLTDGTAGATVWELASAAFDRWSADAAAGDGLAARTATHLLGHALGAQEAGDDSRADRLIASAEAVLADDLSVIAAGVAAPAPASAAPPRYASRPV